MKTEIRSLSRFGRTELYTSGGKTFYGRWVPPPIVLDGNEKTVIVPADQHGQLDLLAHKEYNDRTLFWAIALVNNIFSITDEIVAGKELIIPKLENIRAALQNSEIIN